MATRPAQDLSPGLFRAEALPQLLRASASPCVSIYLPTHRAHPGSKQDPVRYRALVSEVESRLAKVPALRDATRFLEPLRELENQAHWEHSLEGLAVFLSPTLHAAYRLPIPVPERVVVGDSFHVKPLIRFLGSNRRYFVLAVSQNAVSLYEGSPFGAGAVELGGLPESLRGALGVPDLDRALGRHGAPSSVVFHGRGPGREETKETLLKYFRAIDKGLRAFLHDERAPLLLAAVRYYHSIYREANTYPHLLEEGLDGNYERVNGEQIHGAAWPIVKVAFDAQIETWVARYRALAGTGLATDAIEEIAPAALGGRVRCLLAAEGPDEDDTLDDLCEESLKRGAEVFVIPRASMPTGSPLAAVFRF